MLRGLSTTGKRWPFASADSATVAIRAGQHRLSERGSAEMEWVARSIDAVQTPIRWQQRAIQMDHVEIIA